MKNTLADALEQSRASKKFMAWKPSADQQKTVEHGITTFLYIGPTYVNQGESHGLVAEKHFTPQELAATWGLSVDTIRELFDEEPGVLIINRPESGRLPRCVGHGQMTRHACGTLAF